MDSSSKFLALVSFMIQEHRGTSSFCRSRNIFVVSSTVEKKCTPLCGMNCEGDPIYRCDRSVKFFLSLCVGSAELLIVNGIISVFPHVMYNNDKTKQYLTSTDDRLRKLSQVSLERSRNRERLFEVKCSVSLPGVLTFSPYTTKQD